MEFRSLKDKLAFSHEKYKIMRRMERMFAEEGYLYLEPGPFEDYRSFVENGARGDEEYLKTVLPGGEVKLLCADLTGGLVDDVYTEGLKESLKVFYNGEVFRNRGSNVEVLTKVGVEVFGEENLATDVEIFSMAISILRSFHEGAMIEIGGAPIVFYFLESGGFSKGESREILDFLKRRDRVHLGDYLDSLGKLEEGMAFLTVLDCHGSWDEVLEKSGPLRNSDTESLFLHLRELDDFFKLENSLCLRYDFAQVPDFNYYSSFSFRGFFPDCNEEILKGGRYLLENPEGEKIPGVGFSVEVTTLMNYLGERI